MPRHGDAVNSHAPPYYRQDPSVKRAIDERLNSLQRRPISYRNQSIDLQSKSADWFVYDNGLRRERGNQGCSSEKICVNLPKVNQPSRKQ